MGEFPINALLQHSDTPMISTFHYSITPPLHYSIPFCLPDESPMAIERPINKQPATDEILLRHRPPPPTVVAVITVVAHGKKMLLRHRVSLGWIGEIIAPWRI